MTSWGNAFAALWSCGIALRYRHLVVEKQWMGRIGGSSFMIGTGLSPYMFGVRW